MVDFLVPAPVRVRERFNSLDRRRVRVQERCFALKILRRRQYRAQALLGGCLSCQAHHLRHGRIETFPSLARKWWHLEDDTYIHGGPKGLLVLEGKTLEPKRASPLFS